MKSLNNSHIIYHLLSEGFNEVEFNQLGDLVPFLQHEDFFTSEYAIYTFGFHNYTPVKEQLKQISKQNIPNASSAAEKVLNSF